MIDMLRIGMFRNMLIKKYHLSVSFCSIEMPSNCHIVVLLGD